MISSGILEDNALIAEFMNCTTVDKNWSYRIHNNLWKLEGLIYHKDWFWLMPVLEKICRIKIGDGITYVEYAYPRTFGMLSEEDGQIMVRLNGFGLVKADTLIEATYLAIVDFIEYYNKFLKDNVSNNQS